MSTPRATSSPSDPTVLAAPLRTIVTPGSKRLEDHTPMMASSESSKKRKRDHPSPSESRNAVAGPSTLSHTLHTTAAGPVVAPHVAANSISEPASSRQNRLRDGQAGSTSNGDSLDGSSAVLKSRAGESSQQHGRLLESNNTPQLIDLTLDDDDDDNEAMPILLGGQGRSTPAQHARPSDPLSGSISRRARIVLEPDRRVQSVSNVSVDSRNDAAVSRLALEAAGIRRQRAETVSSTDSDIAIQDGPPHPRALTGAGSKRAGDEQRLGLRSLTAAPVQTTGVEKGQEATPRAGTSAAATTTRHRVDLTGDTTTLPAATRSSPRPNSRVIPGSAGEANLSQAPSSTFKGLSDHHTGAAIDLASASKETPTSPIQQSSTASATVNHPAHTPSTEATPSISQSHGAAGRASPAVDALPLPSRPVAAAAITRNPAVTDTTIAPEVPRGLQQAMTTANGSASRPLPTGPADGATYNPLRQLLDSGQMTYAEMKRYMDDLAATGADSSREVAHAVGPSSAKPLNYMGGVTAVTIGSGSENATARAIGLQGGAEKGEQPYGEILGANSAEPVPQEETALSGRTVKNRARSALGSELPQKNLGGANFASPEAQSSASVDAAGRSQERALSISRSLVTEVRRPTPVASESTSLSDRLTQGLRDLLAENEIHDGVDAEIVKQPESRAALAPVTDSRDGDPTPSKPPIDRGEEQITATNAPRTPPANTGRSVPTPTAQLAPARSTTPPSSPSKSQRKVLRKLFHPNSSRKSEKHLLSSKHRHSNSQSHSHSHSHSDSHSKVHSSSESRKHSGSRPSHSDVPPGIAKPPGSGVDASPTNDVRRVQITPKILSHRETLSNRVDSNPKTASCQQEDLSCHPTPSRVSAAGTDAGVDSVPTVTIAAAAVDQPSTTPPETPGHPPIEPPQRLSKKERSAERLKKSAAPLKPSPRDLFDVPGTSSKRKLGSVDDPFIDSTASHKRVDVRPAHGRVQKTRDKATAETGPNPAPLAKEAMPPSKASGKLTQPDSAPNPKNSVPVVPSSTAPAVTATAAVPAGTKQALRPQPANVDELDEKYNAVVQAAAETKARLALAVSNAKQHLVQEMSIHVRLDDTSLKDNIAVDFVVPSSAILPTYDTSQLANTTTATSAPAEGLTQQPTPPTTTASASSISAKPKSTAELQANDPEVDILKRLGLFVPHMEGRKDNKWTKWSHRVIPGTLQDLMPALDKIWDGGNQKYIIKYQEEAIIWNYVHISDKRRFLMCCWNRFTDEPIPRFTKKKSNDDYVRWFLRRYGEIIRFAEIDREVICMGGLIAWSTYEKATDYWGVLMRKYRRMKGTSYEYDAEDRWPRDKDWPDRALPLPEFEPGGREYDAYVERQRGLPPRPEKYTFERGGGAGSAA